MGYKFVDPNLAQVMMERAFYSWSEIFLRKFVNEKNDSRNFIDCFDTKKQSMDDSQSTIINSLL